MPKFVIQRSLYEVRERPSKAYSWAAFLIANVIVEIPYQVFVGIIAWACYYYPIYGAEQASQRQGLMLLFVVQFYVFTSTFASFVIAALPDAETGGTIATLMFIMTLTFNGVMQPPSALPGKIDKFANSERIFIMTDSCSKKDSGSSCTGFPR